MIGPTNAMTVTGTVDPQGVTVGSDTKPVKIVNGVATMVANDLVDTATAQTIEGVKTFTESPAFTAPTTIATAKMSRKITDAVSGNTYSYTDFMDGANTRLGVIGSRILTNPNGSSTVDRGVYMQAGNQGSLYINTNGSVLVAGVRNQRAYDPTHTEDIVTIASLQASTDVVHTSGSEVVLGVKTIDRLITRSFYFNARSGGTTNTWRHMATVNTTNGRIWGLLHYNQSQRFGFFEMQLGTTPKWYMFIKKSINIQNLAINYDGNGTYYIMIRTPYSYQSGAIMPLIIQNNDIIDTSIYNDVIGGTIYDDASEFPLANTVYAQFEGLDTQ